MLVFIPWLIQTQIIDPKMAGRKAMEELEKETAHESCLLNRYLEGAACVERNSLGGTNPFPATHDYEACGMGGMDSSSLTKMCGAACTPEVVCYCPGFPNCDKTTFQSYMVPWDKCVAGSDYVREVPNALSNSQEWIDNPPCQQPCESDEWKDYITMGASWDACAAMRRFSEEAWLDWDPTWPDKYSWLSSYNPYQIRSQVAQYQGQGRWYDLVRVSYAWTKAAGVAAADVASLLAEWPSNQNALGQPFFKFEEFATSNAVDLQFRSSQEKIRDAKACLAR